MTTFSKKKRHGVAYREKPWIVVMGGDCPCDEKCHRFKTEDEADAFIKEQGGEPQPKLAVGIKMKSLETINPNDPNRGMAVPVNRDCYCYEPEVKTSGRPCLACQERMDKMGLVREGKTYAEWLKTPHRHRGRILSCDLCGKVASHPLHRQPNLGEGK